MTDVEAGFLYIHNIWWVELEKPKGKNNKDRFVVVVEIFEQDKAICLSVTGSNRVTHPKGFDVTINPDANNNLNKVSVVDTMDINIILLSDLKVRKGILSDEDFNRVYQTYLVAKN